MNRFRLTLAGIIALLMATSAPLQTVVFADDCQWCDRHAKVVEFVNIHAPDIKDELKEWDDCIESHIPPDADITWFTDDPTLRNALEQCSHLNPESKYSDWMHLESVSTHLAEILNTDCFDMISHRADPNSYLPPEYFFKGTFETDLKGDIMIQPDRWEPRGYPAKSRMTLTLYYDGEPVELVKSWMTLTPARTGYSHYGRMYDNDDSQIRQSRPLEEILWDFERTPRSCEIERPENNEVFPGETVKLDVSRFRDQIDRKSREFNRIVVKADRGKILNGAEAGVLESRKAFKIGDGVVTIDYEAPDECGKDTILVYNSCDIKNKLPLHATMHKDVIGQLNLNVACYDVTLSVKKTVSVTGYGEEEGPSTPWTETKRTMDRRETEEANVTVGLDFDSVSTMWITGDLWAYYKPKKVRVSSLWVDKKETNYTYGNSSKTGIGYEQTVVKIGRVSGGKAIEKPGVQMFALVYDSKTKKPKRIVLAISDIRYELDWTEQLNATQWGGENPPPPKDERRTSVKDKTFQIAPVGESSEDPATGMEIYPDFEVTEGDGVNTFGGKGEKRYTYACNNLGDECKFVETYSWTLTRSKKKGK